MKKITLLITTLALCAPCFAQLGGRIANNTIRNDAAVTLKTATSSIHPPDVGYGIDSAYAMLSTLWRIDSLYGGGANLQTVLNNGYIATGTYALEELDNGSYNVVVDPTFIECKLDGGASKFYLGVFSGYTAFSMEDNTSGYIGSLNCDAFSNNVSMLIPYEPTADGTSPQSDIVLHTTQNPINVSDGAGNTVTVATNELNTTNGSGNTSFLMPTSAGVHYFNGFDIAYGAGITSTSYGYSYVGDVYTYSWSLNFPTFPPSSNITISNTPPTMNGELTTAGDGVSPTAAYYGIGSGSPSVSLSSGSDNRSGVVTIITGTGPFASGAYVTITYDVPFLRNVRASLTPSNQAAAGISSDVYCTSDATSSFTIHLSGGLGAGATYIFTYVIQM